MEDRNAPCSLSEIRNMLACSARDSDQELKLAISALDFGATSKLLQAGSSLAQLIKAPLFLQLPILQELPDAQNALCATDEDGLSPQTASRC